MPIILLVEDNPGDARLIAEHLRDQGDLVNNFEVIHVERVVQAVDILRTRTDIDIILSDITLPDSRGEGTLTALNAAADQVPVIFMTGTNDEGLAVSAIHKGAQDYLLKGHLDSAILMRAINYAIERKKFQNEMARVADSERLNQQRIKLLAEQKRQLIKLNHSKDEFISIASHQLRTPATAVKQYVGMIVEGLAGDISEDQRSLLLRAYESNDRQLTVINELLKTARLDSSKIKLALQPCSINELVEECVSNARSAFELREQNFELELGDDQQVQADRDELKLVIDNLLENASKYTPSGRCIAVKAQKEAGKINISVTDEGVGIRPDDQKLIFDKFSRIDNDLSDTVQGSGLGLYWAKRIVRLHKGSIRVASELGKGSTFTVSLPV